MAYAFVVCVKINNDKLFCNAFPFENSNYGTFHGNGYQPGFIFQTLIKIITFDL